MLWKISILKGSPWNLFRKEIKAELVKLAEQKIGKSRKALI
jgi:hypothetical protein